MGFTYTHFGLCCDFCGHSEPGYNVKKIDCPYGYCQAWACCNVCKAKKLHLKSSCGGLSHEDTCKKAKAIFDRKHKTKEDLIKNGYFVRVAAMTEGKDIKVIFQSKYSQVSYLMSEKIYNSIPLQEVATVGTYARIGYIRRLEEVENA